WKLCLATRGDAAPSGFATSPNTGYALETLKKGAKRSAKSAVTDATQPSPPASAGAPGELDGEGRMIVGVMNGGEMDEATRSWVGRVNQGNITTVTAGPQTMLKAEFTTDDSQSPKAIDYQLLAGPNKGKTQLGIYAFERGELMFCM